MTLIEFMRARLDEDEAAARRSWPGPWSYNPAKRWLEPDQLAREQAGLPVFGGEEFVARRVPGRPVECIALTGAADDPDAMGTAAHIARWDPARVLAEVAAKRAVLELHKPCHVEAEPWSCDSGHYGSEGLGLDGTQPARCEVCVESWGDEQTQVSPCPTLLALVQVWAEHPDFDPVWTVTPGEPASKPAPEPARAKWAPRHVRFVRPDGKIVIMHVMAPFETAGWDPDVRQIVGPAKHQQRYGDEEWTTIREIGEGERFPDGWV